MDYLFKKGQDNHQLFVLLHGTGGDENSLLAVADFLNPKASILALRGQINENGALRFFKRHNHGKFDLEDLNQKRIDLKHFLEQFTLKEGFELKDILFIGFSNGANMAMHMLLEDDTPFRKGILLAPMYPVPISHLKDDKKERSVFLSMGLQDPIVSLSDSQNVISAFQKRKAKIHEFWVRGHEISLESLQAAQLWLQLVEA